MPSVPAHPQRTTQQTLPQQTPPPPPPPEPVPKGWARLRGGGNVEVASPGLRLVARLIDTLIEGAVFFLMITPVVLMMPDTPDTPNSTLIIGVIVALLFALLLALYELSTTAYGASIGKRVAGIRIVSDTDGSAPGWRAAAVRWWIQTVCWIVWIVALIMYASILWRPNRQGWHDLAAGTLVVRARQQTVIH